MSKGGHQGAFIFGAVVGAIAGAGAVLFKTPRSGQEIRQQLTARSTELQERVTNKAGDVRNQTQSVAGPYVDKVAVVAQKGKDVGASVTQTASQQVQKLTGAATSETDRPISSGSMNVNSRSVADVVASADLGTDKVTVTDTDRNVQTHRVSPTVTNGMGGPPLS